jgi:hypothetical protein
MVQKAYIEEVQTIYWPKDKDKQWSTQKTTHSATLTPQTSQKSTLVSGSGNCVARYPTNFVYDWNNLNNVNNNNHP